MGDILDDRTGQLAWDFVNSGDTELQQVARTALKNLGKTLQYI